MCHDGDLARKEGPLMFTPRGPRPTRIRVTDAERHALEAVVHRPTAAHQLVVRAQIVLAAANGLNNAQIARDLQIGLDMARLWRRRWLDTAPSDPEAPLDVVARLSDLPR